MNMNIYSLIINLYTLICTHKQNVMNVNSHWDTLKKRMSSYVSIHILYFFIIQVSRKNILTNIDYMIDYCQFINNPQTAKIFDDMNIIVICDLRLLTMNINIFLFIVILYILFHIKNV
jgi:hypothetical protein